MKWGNPPMPWHEMERRLSGRASQQQDPGARRTAQAGVPRTPGDGSAPPTTPPPASPAPARHTVPYAELHAHSHFSFLDGASAPEDLVREASRLGLAGLALTDHDGLYGAAEFAEASELVAQEQAAAALAHAELTRAEPTSANPTSADPADTAHAAAGITGANNYEHPAASPLLTVYGAELSLGLDAPQLGVADPAGTHLLVLARGTSGYHRLAAAITDAQLAGGEKGRPVYDLDALGEAAHGEWVVFTGCRKGAVRRALTHASTRAEGDHAAAAALTRLVDRFGADNVHVELTHHGHPGDDALNDRLTALAAAHRLPLIATGNVHYAVATDASLAESMAAVRARRSLDELDPHLPASGAAHLRSGAAMLRRFALTPDAVTRTVPLARELAFPLRAATPRLPRLDVPDGHTQMSWLSALAWAGAERRYGAALDAAKRERLTRELRVIEEKDFPGYFLIVHDLVREARERGILCQGRGSAANSAVCYVLGITAVDSIYYGLPFERFLSSMRDEEPDIDVDFDSERREEIIQYVYDRYGRRNAAQVANVITYRPKAAVRDAAKALGYSAGQQRAWTKGLERSRTIAADPTAPLPAAVQQLAERFMSAPRHLGIHSGGMVLTERPVGEVCPIEHARMERRTVLQWDKESCASMGLVKFDLLGLGILNALQQSMDMIAEHSGVRWSIETIPREEPGVYDMLCRADAIGVFQLESRAQLNTLPRLLPRRFYDLVIEIALIRPGPIQGGAVHPYLRRKNGSEPVTYPHPKLIPVLERTLGVPLFQEQLMQMAMAVGNCSAEDADLLRRAMGSKRGEERIDRLKEKLFAGMHENGISTDEAKRLYEQIEAFANFGFAESHSISFALLVYVSSWVKLHYPGAFLAGLLRAQPMGFYAPRTLVEDARRHGVEVRSPDVQHSGALPDLEPLDSARPGLQHNTLHGAENGADNGADPSAAPPRLACHTGQVPPFDPSAPDTSGAHRLDGAYAVRLGLTEIRGIDTRTAERIVRARAAGEFLDLADLARRADLDRVVLEALATAGACRGLGVDRREALWAAAPAADNRERYLPGIAVHVQPPLLPVLNPAEQTALDLWSTGIALDAHPLALLRATLDARGIVRSDRVRDVAPGTRVEVAGLVTHRQRPATASGITFLTLEDEAGTVNIVTWADVWARNRFVARSSPALIITGMLERSPEGVVNVIAERFEPLASPAGIASRDFR